MTAQISNMRPMPPRARRADSLKWATISGALLVLCNPSLAATTAASVTIRQVGDSQTPNTLNFAGVGNDRLRAAIGEYTKAPVTTSGSATAGNGKISTFASAFNSRPGTSGAEPTSAETTATASLTDSFTVSATGDAPIEMVFALHAAGNVTAFNSATNANLGFGGAGATASWQISLSGPDVSLSASGSVAEQKTLVSRNPFLISIVRTETGLGFSEFSMLVGVTPGPAGTTFNLSMLAEASAGVQRGNDGSQSALADFGNTLEWMGLARVTLQDGSPYLGTLSITSDSGFDYGRAVSAVPEPESYALMLGGLALVCWIKRRRG
ncbi:PEP-CTERM sorting domain-containing protein [Roseateles sp. P5_E8]